MCVNECNSCKNNNGKECYWHNKTDKHGDLIMSEKQHESYHRFHIGVCPFYDEFSYVIGG